MYFFLYFSVLTQYFPQPYVPWLDCSWLRCFCPMASFVRDFDFDYKHISPGKLTAPVVHAPWCALSSTELKRTAYVGDVRPLPLHCVVRSFCIRLKAGHA
jgi:hypothetical protein